MDKYDVLAEPNPLLANYPCYRSKRVTLGECPVSLLRDSLLRVIKRAQPAEGRLRSSCFPLQCWYDNSFTYSF